MEMDLSLRVAQYVCTMQCMSATAVTLNSERVEQNSIKRFFIMLLCDYLKAQMTYVKSPDPPPVRLPLIIFFPL